jgi:hypothetical protein
MHPFYIILSVLNLVCLFSFTALFLLPEDSPTEFLAIFAVLGGTFANLIVVIVSLILLPRFIKNYIHKTHKDFLSTHWLGLFNGAFVIVFWFIAVFIVEILDN